MHEREERSQRHFERCSRRCPRPVRGHFCQADGFRNALIQRGFQASAWLAQRLLLSCRRRGLRHDEAVTFDMAIKDTSSQDRIIAPQVNRKRRAMQVGGAVVALLVIAWLAPSAWRLFTAGRSVSAARLQIATVERGAFVRDIAAEGSVVAAVSPTLYASAPGAVVLKVHAGDAVTKDQVVAVIDSPELKNKLAQEQSNADAMNVDYKRAQIDSRKQRLELQKNLDNAGIDAKSAQTDLERNERAFKNGAIAQMQMAGADFRPGVDDADDRLAHEFVMAEPHLQGARAVAEGAQVVGTDPALGAQGVRGLAGMGHRRFLEFLAF